MWRVRALAFAARLELWPVCGESGSCAVNRRPGGLVRAHVSEGGTDRRQHDPEASRWS